MKSDHGETNRQRLDNVSLINFKMLINRRTKSDYGSKESS